MSPLASITIAFYCFHSGVTLSPRVEGVTPHLFLPVRPRFSTILCKFAHNIFFPSGVTPWRGGHLSPLVTPLVRSRPSARKTAQESGVEFMAPISGACVRGLRWVKKQKHQWHMFVYLPQKMFEMLLLWLLLLIMIILHICRSTARLLSRSFLSVASLG